MRKEIKKYTMSVEKEEVTWIAADGAVFKDEEMCREWESSYAGTLNKSFVEMNRVEVDPYNIGLGYVTDEDRVFVVVPKTITDITVLNGIIRMTGASLRGATWASNMGNPSSLAMTSDGLSANDIGRKMVFVCGCMYDGTIFDTDWIDIEDLDEVKRRLANEWNALEKMLVLKEENENEN